MLPIYKLLSRIRWDKEFGAGRFEISYYDRVEDRLVDVAFTEIVFEEGNKHSFLAMDEDGVYQSIPFHRVRVVSRNGEVIWQRPALDNPTTT